MPNSMEVGGESVVNWDIKFTQISDYALNLQSHNSAPSYPPAAHQRRQRKPDQEKVANSVANAMSNACKTECQAKAVVPGIGELADIEIDMDVCLRSLTDSLPSTEICPF